MKKNFWSELKKPFFCLAPMDGVTDPVFRKILTQTAKPDVLFTEFTSVEGLASIGVKRVMQRLKFDQDEHPIVAQIWGLDLEAYTKAAALVWKLGFDGIDINMGCPVRDVTNTGACSALVNNPELAAKIIAATKKGAPQLPVSVKTRIGFNTIKTEEWLGFLLKQDLAVLTVHGRTAKEQSKVPAHWDEIGKAVKIRDDLKISTLIVGNGDVKSVAEGLAKVQKYRVDGIMIGTGIFQDFWLFDKQKHGGNVTPAERVKQTLKHIELFEATFGEGKHFEVLKKFFKIYINGFDGASDLRQKLMETHKGGDAKKVFSSFLRMQESNREATSFAY